MWRKMIHDSGIGHSEIEMEFDRKLMKEDYINPVGYLPTGHPSVQEMQK